jgi:hypothetical protein
MMALLRFRLGIVPVPMLSAALGAASRLPELVSI